MNKDKQIEKIEKIIQPIIDNCWRNDWFPNGDEIAKAIYDNDYRKASDVTREIVEVIENITEDFYPTEWHRGYNDALRDLAGVFKKRIVDEEEKGECTCNKCFHNCTTFCDFEHYCKKKFMELDEETDKRLGLISE